MDYIHVLVTKETDLQIKELQLHLLKTQNQNLSKGNIVAQAVTEFYKKENIG